MSNMKLFLHPEANDHNEGILEVKPQTGEWVGYAIKRLVQVSISCNQNAVLYFNNFVFYATPNSRAKDLINEYLDWINEYWQ